MRVDVPIFRLDVWSYAIAVDQSSREMVIHLLLNPHMSVRDMDSLLLEGRSYCI
jgi:hypothetical protein